MVKKLAFSVLVQGQPETVNASIFQGVDGKTYAALDGSFFNGCELSIVGLDVLIAGLQMVRRTAVDEAYSGWASVES